MDREPERLALDVPERLVDARDSAGQDGTAAVEATLGENLPVVLDRARIPADQVAGELLDRGGHRDGPALDDGLAPAGDALIGADRQEQPTGLDEKRFQCGDPHA